MNKIVLCILAAVSLLMGVSANAQGIKWHPGHYLVLNGKDSQYTHFKHIDEIRDVWAIRGVQVRIWWQDLEPWRGHYDFSKIDAYLKKLKSLPTDKRLVLRIMDRRFDGKAGGILPSYMLTDPTFKGGLVRTRSGYAAKLYEQPVMDRLIELYKHIGWKYNWDPYFEGVYTEESTLNLPSPLPWGFTWDKLMWQYKRLLMAARNAMPNTNIFMNSNWLGTAGLMSDFMQFFPSYQIAAGSSNVIPHIMNHGQRVWTGDYGGVDYRGYLAISNAIEAEELGGGTGDYAPWKLNDFAYWKLRVSHLFWVRNTWAGDWSQRWYSGILPYLKKWPKIRTGCPSNYGWCKR